MKKKNQKIASISFVVFLLVLNHLFISTAENFPKLESFAMFLNVIGILAYLFLMAKAIIDN